MTLTVALTSLILAVYAVAESVNTVEDNARFTQNENSHDLDQANLDLSQSLKDYPLTNTYFPRKRYYRRSLLGSPFRRRYQNYQNGYGLTPESVGTSHSTSGALVTPTLEQVVRAIKNYYSLGGSRGLPSQKYNQFGGYETSLTSASQPSFNKYLFYGYGNSNQDSFMPYASSSSSIGSGTANSNSNSGTFSTDYSASPSGSYSQSPYESASFGGFSQILYPTLTSATTLKAGRNFYGSNSLFGGASTSSSSYQQSSVPSFLSTNTPIYGSSILPLFGSSVSRRTNLFRPNRYSYGSLFKPAADKSFSRSIVDEHANRPSIKPN